MGNRSRGLLLTFLVGAVISLVPMPAAAQSQTQTQPLHFNPIFNPRALCPPESSSTVSMNIPKKSLKALPADVIEPEKTPEGWPDLQGSWNSLGYQGSALHSVEQGVDPIDSAIQCQSPERLSASRSNTLIDPMGGRIPYQPWAKAHQMELLGGLYAPGKRMDLDVEVRCLLLGVPHAMMGWGIELRYVPGAVVILSNKGTRIIPMEATPHLSENVQLFMGDSRGHWESHTLVVETVNNRDGTWFDKHGTFHSEAMHVTERFTLVSQSVMYYEVTIVDPAVFTQPWKMAQTLDRQKISKVMDPEAREDTCHEGESDGNSEPDRTVRAGLRAKAAGIHGYHLHVDLVTGKAIDPEDQKYLDESGQPLGYSFAPGPDDAIPQVKDGSSPH